jgi:hypothetical protein
MKRFSLALGLAAALLTVSTGCYSTVDGHSRAGVPFVRDSIEGRYERPVDQVFAAAKEVVKFNGVLEGENTINKSLWGRVDKRRVWLKVDEVDPRVTRVVVQARRGATKDIALAAELEKQVALRLIK